MSESIENLIEVTNDNIKSESQNIQEYITEITIIQNTKNHKKLEDLSDSLNHSLKINRRLKLLKNKLIKMKSKKDSLIMLAYKPERIDTDDELEWKEEENQIIKSKIISSLKHKLDGESDSESESESDSEFENDIENPIKLNRKSKSI